MIESIRIGAMLRNAALALVFLFVPVNGAAAEGTNSNSDNPTAEGNSLFNQYCAHCHGPNAEQGERPRDLRRLKRRYGDDRAEVFRTTIANGRPEKGMPSWAGVLDDSTADKIWAFLETVQK